MVLDARKRKGSVGPRGPGLRGVVRAFSAMIIVVLLVLAAYFAIRLADMSTLAVA